MCDLQGPKIRVGKFKDGKVTLEKGAALRPRRRRSRSATASASASTTRSCRATSSPGAVLLLDDGKIVLDVTDVRGEEVHTMVRHGGVLSNNKGINRQGGGLTAPALTAKDMEDIKTATKLQADYLAVSFPKTGADMYMARELMRAAGGKAFLIAKIERAEAVGEAALIDIMRGSDGIMVARGDLAVEVGDASVPALQKKMIRLAREQNKLTITATQMMESMISSPVPTRAEVSDVANAVLDGTDAVMLSAETASGRYPVETIEAMDRICVEAEQTQPLNLEQDFLNRVFTRVDQSIAMAALFTAYHLKVKCIASLTESGSTALWMSRLNCGVPIYALTSQTATRYRCALFRDVFPLMVKYVGHDREELLQEAEKVLVENKVVKEGDLIVLTIGEPIGKAGGTNTMKIVKVGEHLKAMNRSELASRFVDVESLPWEKTRYRRRRAEDAARGQGDRPGHRADAHGAGRDGCPTTST